MVIGDLVQPDVPSTRVSFECRKPDRDKSSRCSHARAMASEMAASRRRAIGPGAVSMTHFEWQRIQTALLTAWTQRRALP